MEQVMERTLLGPLPSRLTAGIVERGLALPLLTVYMLLALKTLKTSALPHLARLRAAVQVSDDVYAGHVQRILYTNPRAEAVLLLSALAVVLAWFVVFRQPFPLVNAYLPPLPLQAILVIAAYTIFGWAGLTLVYSSTRFGLGLGALAKRRLKVNVFAPDGLLPFGGLKSRPSHQGKCHSTGHSAGESLSSNCRALAASPAGKAWRPASNCSRYASCSDGANWG